MIQQTEGIAALLFGLFADSPVGLALLDTELRYVAVNDAIAELNGVPASAHVGRRPEEVVPELAPLLVPLMSRVLHGAPVVNVEIELAIAARPGPRTTLESFYPLFDADGHVAGVGGVAIDITDRKDAQRGRDDALALLDEELHEERRIVGTLQRALLPRRLPDIPGASIAARYEAAGERFEVGGDFYDAFEIPSGEWLVVVGDVCGKGPDAAALTAMARFTLRAEASRAAGPGRLLSLLGEEMLLRQDEPENHDDIARFATAACAWARPVEDGLEVRVACAGQPDPLALRVDGSFERIPPCGPPCGAFPDIDYADIDVLLRPGEALVLYTDGVLDSGAPARQLPIDGLAGALAGRPPGSAEQIAVAVAEIVAELGGGEPRDDYAVLVLAAR